MSENNEEIFIKNLREKYTPNKKETNKPLVNESKKRQIFKTENAFQKLKDLAMPKKDKKNLEEKKDNNEIKDKNEEKSSSKEIEEGIKNIKKDEKLISYKGQSDAEALAKELRWPDEDETENEKKLIKRAKNDLLKLDEFEWEKENNIEKPLKTDFENNKNNLELSWLKNEVNGKNKKQITEKKETEFFWKNTGKIEEPLEKDFEVTSVKHPKWINKKDTPKNKLQLVKQFEWEENQSIDQPKLDDFEKEDFDKTDFKKDKFDDSFVQKENEDLPNNDTWKKNTLEQIENELMPENIEKFDWENQSKIDAPRETDFTPFFEVTKKVEIIKHPRWVHKINFLEGEGLKTPIDLIFEILEQYKQVDMGKAAEIAGIDYYTLEKIIKTFEEYGILEIKYPTSLSRKPTIFLLNPIPSKIIQTPAGIHTENYSIIVDNVPAKISIITTKEEVRPIYGISLPAVGKYTKKFLNFIKNEIAETIPIELEEMLDPKKSKKLKIKFFEESQKHLKNYFRTSKQEMLDVLSGIVLHDMYGLGDIEILLGDDMLEEIAINSSKTPITVYHRVYGWLKTNFYPGTEEEISNYSSQIGRKIGREITTLKPILDAHLLSGDRVNATLSPISSEGNTLTIRRFARQPWTLVDFIGKSHTMNAEMGAFLWLAMQYELNVIVAGGTASGKTSTLNTLLAMVPGYHRIISIEDVREIILPKFLEWNWVPMVTRAPNPEGLGEVTMLDCMITSLRMRPDRIIIGEIRQKKEAEVMMEAIETGHSIYSTIHANSAYQVLRRLAEPPMSVPPMQIEQIDLVVTQFRDRKTNRRRTYEIAELEQTSTGKGLQVNTIYKWAPRTDTWEKLNKPTKIMTILNLHTGLTENEIEKEISEREKILKWLVKKGINGLNEIGFVMKKYYINKEDVLRMAEKNISKEDVIEMM